MKVIKRAEQVVSKLERETYRIEEEKELLRAELIAYGLPIPAEGGTLGEWAELLKKEREKDGI